MIIERIPVRSQDVALLLPPDRRVDHPAAAHGVVVLALGPHADPTGPGEHEVAVGLWCAPMDMRNVAAWQVTKLHALTRVGCAACRRAARHYTLRASMVSRPDGPLAPIPPMIVNGPAL